jgi:hypothetical protein
MQIYGKKPECPAACCDVLHFNELAQIYWLIGKCFLFFNTLSHAFDSMQDDNQASPSQRAASLLAARSIKPS